jgi:hypothetical protein
VKPIPLNPETEAIARRVVWFEEPAEALEDPIRFMAYAMRHAVHDDMKVLRRYVSDEDFREARDKAPPGIIDPLSYAAVAKAHVRVTNLSWNWDAALLTRLSSLAYGGVIRSRVATPAPCQ